MPASIKFVNSTINLLDKTESLKEICQYDKFISYICQFDVQSRIGTTEPCSVVDYFDFVKSHLLDWDDNSIAAITSIITDVGAKYASKFTKMKLPEHINIVLTDGKDESGAAYCRNMSTIVLPVTSNRPVKFEPKIGEKGFDPCDAKANASAEATTQSSETIKDCANSSKWYTTFVHELFHIWSRNNTDARNRMYERIGYHHLDKPLYLPGDLAHQKITNPDAPAIDCYTLLKTGKNKIYMPYVPVLYSKNEYDPSHNKSFFDYLVFVLMGVQIKHIQNSMHDSDIVLDPSNIISPDKEPAFFDLIGHNTMYVIHPEEILADNFVLYIMHDSYHNIPGIDKPEVLEMMREVFLQIQTQIQTQSQPQFDQNDPITNLRQTLVTLQNQNAALKKEMADDAEKQKLLRSIEKLKQEKQKLLHSIEKLKQENEQIERAKSMRQKETDSGMVWQDDGLDGVWINKRNDLWQESAETMLFCSGTPDASVRQTGTRQPQNDLWQESAETMLYNAGTPDASVRQRQTEKFDYDASAETMLYNPMAGTPDASVRQTGTRQPQPWYTYDGYH